MAKVFDKNKVQVVKSRKLTSQGGRRQKTSSMNKHKRRIKGL